MDRLESLLEYDLWASLEVIRALSAQDGEVKCPDAVSHLSHLLQAQCIWYNRIEAKETRLEIWPQKKLSECASWARSNHESLLAVLTAKEEKIQYKNSKGQGFEGRVDEILHHLVIHGQHHRAQIALLMRQAKLIPAVTDYIFYLRQVK